MPRNPNVEAPGDAPRPRYNYVSQLFAGYDQLTALYGQALSHDHPAVLALWNHVTGVGDTMSLRRLSRWGADFANRTGRPPTEAELEGAIADELAGRLEASAPADLRGHGPPFDPATVPPPPGQSPAPAPTPAGPPRSPAGPLPPPSGGSPARQIATVGGVIAAVLLLPRLLGWR